MERLALVLYLSAENSWTNKFGADYSFDDLALELLSRSDFESLACGGTHLLYTLAAMLQVDAQEQMLSAEVGERVRSHLRDTARMLPKQQSLDGSWSVGWRKSRSAAKAEPPAVLADRWPDVLVTGHHEEAVGHYVVVIAVNREDNVVQVVDGTTAAFASQPMSEFRKTWSGYLLVLDNRPRWTGLFSMAVGLGVVSGCLAVWGWLSRRREHEGVLSNDGLSDPPR